MSAHWTIEDADLDQVIRLGAFVALFLRPGDIIALSGALGAGKTTFARGVVRAILEDDAHDIPSPTFALVQSYEQGRLPIAHIDCYRMEGADELQELGLDDALIDGAALVEWPERVAQHLPADRLEINFTDGTSEDIRTVTIKGHGVWKPRANRLKAMMDFCAGTEWADATPLFLQGDASTRAYARLLCNGDTVVLMDSPARPDGAPVRDGKPYSQLVHLAENVKPFVAIAAALGEAGLSIPRILAHDLAGGFLITEDLGDRVFAGERGIDPSLEGLYAAAVDVLAHLKNHPPASALPLPAGEEYTLPAYDQETLEFEAELLLDWFYPAVHGHAAGDDARNTYLDTLRPLLGSVTGQEDDWVLRDYHSPNLLWLPEREGIAQVGVIDFQDALVGHAAYDLVALLQDARRDIPEDLEGRLFAHYCRARAQSEAGFDLASFSAAYAVLGAQRNCKILGIFTRLAKRDGKHDYLAHIPRVSDYLERNLGHPRLEQLRAWFGKNLPADLRAKPFNS